MASLDHRKRTSAGGDIAQTLSDVLAKHACRHAARSALIFLEDGEAQSRALSYGELHQAAQRLAHGFRQKGWTGQRVLLMFHSGIEYIETFLGCLYAGVVAVPLYPPRNNWHAERAAAIARDADACAVLTTGKLRDDIAQKMQAIMAEIEIIASDAMSAQSDGEWINAERCPDDVAYLQYTSGSTGTPKGVMVSHRNLLANARLYSAAAGVSDGDVFVSWLPIFHDMGLVQGIVMPLVRGGTAVFMPPAVFVQKPVRWLRAISVYRGVFSGGPNFAYELCATKVSREEAQGLDLRSWRVALNGAEPISAATLEKFRQAFAGAGFDPAAFAGGYGLAEATLYVTCGEQDQAPTILQAEKSALEKDRIVLQPASAPTSIALVSSGTVKVEPAVRIVSHHTGHECGAREIGEIWVGGDSICAGYWNRPEESEETFHATFAGAPGMYFMRTGDLGFIEGGQLYVTGRIKDLIIIRGANHYPQDIEATVEQAHPDLRSGGWGAAFSIPVDGEERLIVVQEVEREARRRLDAAAVGSEIARLISARHGVDVHAVAFVAPGGVPKTSSGKIQRRICRQLFLDGKLEELGRWQRASVESNMPANTTAWTGKRQAEAALIRLAAELLDMPASSIARDAPFSELGFDSIRIVEFVARTAAMSGCALPPSAAFDYPNIAALAAHLLGDRANDAVDDEAAEPIAIIGMACRFPGADGVEEFWNLLEQGSGAIREIDAERAALTGFNAEPHAAYRVGGLLDDVAGFDPGVFGISPREAHSIDPQQRLLLQTAWHALEASHIAPDSLQGSATGVFVGICTSDYFRLQKEANALDAYSGTGSALSIAANRLSYCFGLQGPSMAIDTACSSSLVAVHQACRSLASGESTLALAGGVNLILSSDYGRIFAQANMLSPTGQCRTFDDGADGYVRGEGCGVVVLKRLADAQRDGDDIIAVIRGSAINQDGFSNGLTAPNGVAQQNVIRAAHRRAGVAPESIGFVETHGTGTPLGDPIEIHALSQVLDGKGRANPCWLGAVKTHIGHLEAAAGIAGLIKTALALRHRRIPANRNLEKINSHLQLQASRLAFPTGSTDWKTNSDVPRRAGVSSFGFGGTNAHVVLEEFVAPVSQPDAASATPCWLALSAHSEASLRRMAQAYAQTVEAAGDAHLRTFCRSANRARAGLSKRAVVMAENAGEMRHALLQLATGAGSASNKVICGRADRKPRIAFLFTGQGSQYFGMGKALYESEPVFRRHLEWCDGILQPRLQASIISVMMQEHSGQHLDDTRFAQPAILALQLALTALLKDWGVMPEFVLGHSIGEYAAACAAGMMTEQTALEIVCERARLMSQAPGCGAMISVRADWDRVHALLETLPVDLAAVNSPDQCVLSGDADVITQAMERLATHGIDAVRLQVSHAFHSRLMAPVLDEFGTYISACDFTSDAKAIFIPSGGRKDVAQADYWVSQIREPVYFFESLQRAVDEGADTFVEIGSQPILTGLGRRAGLPGEWIGTLRSGEDAVLQCRTALAQLYVNGADLALARIDRHLAGHAWTLPGYPFERTPYWFERGAARATAGTTRGLLGERVPLALDSLTAFQSELPNSACAYLADHCVFGETVMPAAAYLSLALAGTANLHPDARVALRDVRFVRPMSLSEVRFVQTLLEKKGDAYRVSVASRCGDDAWQIHMQAEVELFDEASSPVAGMSDAQIAMYDAHAFYAAWAERGLQYGPAFQAIRMQGHQEDVIQAELHLPHGVNPLTETSLHPVLLDGAFQILGHALQSHPMMASSVPLPVRLGRLVCFEDMTRAGALLTRAKLHAEPAGHEVTADIELYDLSGRLLARVEQLGLRWLSRADLGARRKAPVYREEWVCAESVPATESSSWWMAGIDAVEEPWAFRDARVEYKAMRSDALGDMMKSHLRSAGNLRGCILHFSPAYEADGDLIALAQSRCMALQAALTSFSESDAAMQGYEFVVVTHGALAPNRHDAMPSIAMTALSGLIKSAAREYPHLTLRHVDLPLDPTPQDWQMLERMLAPGMEAVSAICDGAAYVPRLQAWNGQAIAASKVSKQGSYLITGGLGALGLTLAEHLVTAGARHLVLVSRRSQPGDEAGRRIAAMVDRGAHVEIRAADVSRRDQVRTLVAAIEKSAAPLCGIVHAAGVKDDRPLSSIDPESWNAALGAKAAGAYWLDIETRHLKLDFFIGFSSIAGVLGSAGQANYAAANSLMAGVLMQRHALQGDAVIVDWGPWQGEGMANDARLHEHLAQQGVALLDPQLACEALDDVLSACLPQALVADIDWNILAAHRAADKNQISALVSGIEEADAASALPDGAALSELDSQQATYQIGLGLATLIAEVLKLSPQELEDRERFDALRLSSLGIDSLMAMELRNRVRAWVRVDLPAHILIGGGTVREVVELIYQKLLVRRLSDTVSDTSDSPDQEDDAEVLIL